MVGLGELENRAEDYRKRNIKVYAISIDNTKDAGWVADQCPSLNVIADPKRQLIDAFSVLHPDSSPTGDDTAAPTTILIDRSGTVLWVHRPENLFSRYPAHELLDTIDEQLREQPGQ